MSTVGPNDAGSDEVVVGEAVTHWRRLTFAGVFNMVMFGGCALVAPGLASRCLSLLLVAVGLWAAVLALARLLRPGAQLHADRDGVRCKVWHGYRELAWTDITAIEPVHRVQPLDATLKTPGGKQMPWVPSWFSRALGGEDRGFQIRFGSRLRQACYVYEAPGHNLTEIRRRLVGMWHHATAAQ